MRSGLLAACLLLLIGCRSALDDELVAALASEPGATLVLDAGGAVVCASWPVADGAVPPRAAQAARAIQPDGTRHEYRRERGADGDGFRLHTWYGARLRTVLVSAAGEILHKSWQVAAGEAPSAAVTAAAERAPGAVTRIEILQDPGREPEYRVTTLGPDHRQRAWIGDAQGRGQVRTLATVAVEAVTR